MSLGGQTFLSPSHLPTESARSGYSSYPSWKGPQWSRNLQLNFCPGQDFNPKPLALQSSTLITGSKPQIKFLLIKNLNCTKIRSNSMQPHIQHPLKISFVLHLCFRLIYLFNIWSDDLNRCKSSFSSILSCFRN